MIFALYREPTLDEMLSDSIIQAVMAADGVDPQTVRATLREVCRARTTPVWQQPPAAWMEPARISGRVPAPSGARCSR